MHRILIVIITIQVTQSQESQEKLTSFPGNFRFGVGTSSYQIEGGWNANGKGESIWDRASHTPGRIRDGATGDIACDSYNQFREDIRLLQQLRVSCYRFSVSWTRLFPNGTVNNRNEDGVRYYNELIDGLIQAGVEPMITLFHWDTPQTLQDLGGWTSAAIVDRFEEYADAVFGLFGDRVKVWTTLNEPANYCVFGNSGISAPFTDSSGVGDYLCTYNLIRAHAKAYRLYQKKYKRRFGGRGVVGITLDSFWNEAEDPKSRRDQQAAQRALEYYIGSFVWPIFKTGRFPDSMRTTIDQRSLDQGLTYSRLPSFTVDEQRAILGSADFLGLNHYATFKTKFDNQTASRIPSRSNDRNIIESIDPSWPAANGNGFTVRPVSLYRLLLWLDRNLGRKIPIAITESGYNGFPDESLNDTARVDYLNGYLQAVLNAINDGVNVNAYDWWSLMDNFEWRDAYTKKFGLYQVDFSDPNRTRTAKKSAMVYQNIIVTRRIDPAFNPNDFY